MTTGIIAPDSPAFGAIQDELTSACRNVDLVFTTFDYLSAEGEPVAGSYAAFIAAVRESAELLNDALAEIDNKSSERA